MRALRKRVEIARADPRQRQGDARRRAGQHVQPEGAGQRVGADRRAVTEASAELSIAIAAFAARPRVVVAADFDGTLSPFVLDPMQARAVPGGLEVLQAAAALDGVTVAVVSGRDLATLATLTGFGPDDGITLIGSHGAQVSLGEHANLDDPAKINPTRDAGLLDEDAIARPVSYTHLRAHETDSYL